MKKALLSMAAVATLFTACKKSDDDNGGGTSTNQWKIGGTTYTALAQNGVALNGSTLAGTSASSTSGSVLWVSFGGAVPTTSGTYKIVETADAADEIDITAIAGSAGSGTVYGSMDRTANPTAAVTVTGGKISVTIPEVWAQNAANANDSVKVSGNLTQQ